MHPLLGLLVGDEKHSLPWVGLCGEMACDAWACARAQHMSMRCNLPVAPLDSAGWKWEAVTVHRLQRLPPVAHLPYRSAVSSAHKPLTLPICRLALYAMEMQTRIVM